MSKSLPSRLANDRHRGQGSFHVRVGPLDKLEFALQEQVLDGVRERGAMRLPAAMRRTMVVSALVLGTVLSVTARPAPAESRIATQLSAERTTYYVHLDPIGYQWQQTCVPRPLAYGDIICTPDYPIPYVDGASGSYGGWARLTDLDGNGVAGAAVRFVGHATGTTCTVPTDAEGVAWPWCEAPLGWSLDEQGYDVFFDGNELYAPAEPASSPAATVALAG